MLLFLCIQRIYVTVRVCQVTATPSGFEFELEDKLTQDAIRKHILEEVDLWSRARASAEVL